MRYEIVPATRAHAQELARHMRPADFLEVSASHESTVDETVEMSVRVSSEAWTLLIGDEVAAIWGVQPICAPARVGLVWMLSADAIDEHPVLFWRLCKKEVARLMREWRTLFNWIDARYDASLRWAKRLGFELDEPRPHGRNGEPFRCAAIVR